MQRSDHPAPPHDARANEPRPESTTGSAHDAPVFGKLADTAPDPAYWTGYDYSMIEREARAERRAHAYATLARIARGLYRLARSGMHHARSTATLMKQQRWTPSS